MPIIHDEAEYKASINNPKHICPVPGKYGTWDGEDRLHFSSHTVNTIWKCGECEKYFVVRMSSGGGYEVWRPLRWYHLTAHSRLNKPPPEEG